MHYMRKEVLAGNLVFGTWCNLGSSITTEMAGMSGFDWILVDLEHGAGDYGNLVHQLQALSATPAVPIVRIEWNDPVQFKRVLDLGASGIMVPYVQSAEEAQLAAKAMRYPPAGIRGVAKLNRASDFGTGFGEYFRSANDNLLTVVQIETEAGVENAEEIAAVEGVDVLFVGPLDLSTGMGIHQQYDNEQFLAALSKVGDAAKAHGKAAGILLLSDEMLPAVLERGYTFIAMGSDGSHVAAGMRRVAEMLNSHKGTSKKHT
jgi:2-keto-3-deoxy-L-rhamnonate aldolase RhmA